MHDSGSRTPLHYGSQTPIHDGSRTPNANSEWDPSVSNSYPSPSSFNPSTPGYQINGPFTPQTPGGTAYENSYSPYQPSPGYNSVVSTPSPAATGYGQSPSSNHAYNMSSPAYSPNTPYNPQTPGAGLDVLSMTEWHTVDIEVSPPFYI